MKKELVALFLLLLVMCSFVGLSASETEPVTVGVQKGDIFTWDVSTIGNYQVFATPFGFDYNKMTTIRIEVTDVANPVVTCEVTFSYDNGTQNVHDGSINVQTGEKGGFLLWSFLYSANLNVGDKLPSGNIDQTLIKSYLGQDRQVNHYVFTDPHGVGIEVDGRFAILTSSCEAYLDKLTGAMFESNEFFTVEGTIYNVTLNYRLIASNVFGETSLWGDQSIRFAVSTGQENYYINATSNSALSDFSYSASEREIRFNVIDESGTMGNVYVSIPKALINDISSLKVYLDNDQIEYTDELKTDFHILNFICQQGTHLVTISLGTPAGSDANLLGSWLIYGAVIIAVVIAVIAIIAVRRRRIKNKVLTHEH